MRAALGKAKRTPRISTLIWFLIRDEPVEPRGQSDRWQSGLRVLGGGAKPAYGAWLAERAATPHAGHAAQDLGAGRGRPHGPRGDPSAGAAARRPVDRRPLRLCRPLSAARRLP